MTTVGDGHPAPRARPTAEAARARLGLGALAVLVLASGALAVSLWTGSSPAPVWPAEPEPPAVIEARAVAAASAPPAASTPAAPTTEAPPPAARSRPERATADADGWALAMGEAMAAADRRAWSEAEAALQRAAAARPAAPELADLAARVAEGRRGDEIARLRQAAEHAADGEDWRAVANACEEALKLDPDLAFAQQGLALARTRQQVVAAIEGHLARPDRLAVEAVAREAELALERARESAPGPRLAARLAALESALALARTAVTVRLVSDRLTQVTVLRLGPQGAFAEKALALRPGTWTVVGTRAGYRDVRQTVAVAPGRELPPVVVRCEEPL